MLVWFVNPLDRTRPYLNGSPDFAIRPARWLASIELSTLSPS
ncbi:hypothetical protein ACWFR1_00245 [Streptomyces sp. NPDC055103]